MKEQHHKIIWLQPWCDGCERHANSIDNGRTWCQDDVYGPCEECKAEPVKYIAASMKATKEIERLRAALQQIVDEADSDDGMTAWDGGDIAAKALGIVR